VDQLIGQMDIAEKVGQVALVEKGSIKDPADIKRYALGGLLSGGGGYPTPNTPENWAKMVNDYQSQALQTRLAIPMIYGVDAVHGHAAVYGATVFPHNIGLGAANDPALTERIGVATAKEMIATGIYWNYSPVVAVVQDVRWGRTYEAFGEQTALVSTHGVALVKGLQGAGVGKPGSVLATVKHFVGDGGTAWGSSTTENFKIDQGVTPGTEAALRAIHLPPYQAAIKTGARSIMVSFSSALGVKMHAQRYLITEVLKGELGFSGFVVSDWAALDQLPGDAYQQVVTGMNAGLDMIMIPSDYKKFTTLLTQAVEKGDVPMSRLDDAVRRILRVKVEMGLFDRPMSDRSFLPTLRSPEHRALAREAVSKSLVLLKHENAVLPLAQTLPTLYVAGKAADDLGIQSGGWTIEWQGKEGNIIPGRTILGGLQEVAPLTKVTYDRNGNFSERGTVGIVVVGEIPYAEGHGDSATLALSPFDLRLTGKVRGQVDRLIVIVMAGRPVILTDILPQADAVIMAWLPGGEGAGVADVLFGKRGFTGKLPVTWPRAVTQLPFDLAQVNSLTGEASPLYPFGYGLN
jgi:beta-glucosidase